MATASYYTGSVHTALNAGGAFAAVTVVRSGASLTALTLADMDKDGDPDLLAPDSNYHLTLQLNGHTGPLATAVSPTRPSRLPYPNPVLPGGSVRGQLPAVPASLELLDARDRVVCTTPATGFTITLEPAGLSPGLYLLRAADWTTRLILE